VVVRLRPPPDRGSAARGLRTPLAPGTGPLVVARRANTEPERPGGRKAAGRTHHGRTSYEYATVFINGASPTTDACPAVRKANDEALSRTHPEDRLRDASRFPVGDPAAWQTVAMASETTSKVRTWAKQTGLQVSDRGRLPASLLDAYQAANTTQAPPPAKRPGTVKSSTAAPSKKRPSASGRKKAAVATETQDDAPLTADQELFGDQQSVLRRLTSLEGQVAELLGKLETAARALDPSGNSRT